MSHNEPVGRVNYESGLRVKCDLYACKDIVCPLFSLIASHSQGCGHGRPIPNFKVVALISLSQAIRQELERIRNPRHSNLAGHELDVRMEILST